MQSRLCYRWGSCWTYGLTQAYWVTVTQSKKCDHVKKTKIVATSMRSFVRGGMHSLANCRHPHTSSPGHKPRHPWKIQSSSWRSLSHRSPRRPCNTWMIHQMEHCSKVETDWQVWQSAVERGQCELSLRWSPLTTRDDGDDDCMSYGEVDYKYFTHTFSRLSLDDKQYVAEVVQRTRSDYAAMTTKYKAQTICHKILFLVIELLRNFLWNFWFFNCTFERLQTSDRNAGLRHPGRYSQSHQFFG